MKRVKVILMSALVVACVGGALAFKAENLFHDTYYCGTTTTTCPDKYEGMVNFIVFTETLYCSTTTSTDCQLRVSDN